MQATLARGTQRFLSPSILAAAVIATLLAPSPAHAHFLWLSSDREQGKPVVRAFLSETPVPAGEQFMKYIEKAKISTSGKPLSWTKEKETYLVNITNPDASVIDGFCDLGLMKRNGPSFRLLYTGRAQFGASSTMYTELQDNLRVRVVADPGQTPYVQVTFRGKPVEGAVVKLLPDKSEEVEVKTDAKGRLVYAPLVEGRAGLLAKWSVKEGGEVEGKSYEETRYYATLTFEPDAPAKTAAAAPAGKIPAPYANMPEPATSLGAAVLGHWLYVYGGHTGKVHVYDKTTPSKHFRRLDLRDRKTWEELPAGPALQGVTLISHGGSIYRIGGMYPRNEPGKTSDLVSVADFARYSPETKTWTALPSLPAARSTHDSVVVGDKIYVLGGWTMKGQSEDSDFVDAAVVFDMARPETGWQKLPDPGFHRRALAAGTLDDKVYVIGGLTEDGNVVKTVNVYDPAARAWSQGPELPGSKRQGFAPSAFAVGGKLYVCGTDGDLLRLNLAANRWDVVAHMVQPRLAHRLVPGIEKDVLAVGGNVKGKATQAIESIPVDSPGLGLRTP